MPDPTPELPFHDRSGHRLHLKNCPSCGKNFYGRTDQTACSHSCGATGKQHGVHKGDANPNWRGDDVGYHGMHIRVRKARGQADHCERCGAADPSLRYDWASLVDNPKSVDDFAPMCRSCHRKFDFERDTQRPGYKGHNTRKLTVEIVRGARQARAAGERLQDIAARYGVPRGTLQKAINGQSWAWLDRGRA